MDRVRAAPSFMIWRPSAVSFFFTVPSSWRASREMRRMIPARVRVSLTLSSIILTAYILSRGLELTPSRAIPVRISNASSAAQPAPCRASPTADGSKRAVRWPVGPVSSEPAFKMVVSFT